jgi:RHS repeat-associated protein
LTASAAYDAWGNPETTGGLTTHTPFGYAGGYTDATGLSYLINRYYDPQTGQFLTVDPLVDVTGMPYAYGADDPVLTADPSGLCAAVASHAFGVALYPEEPPSEGARTLLGVCVECIGGDVIFPGEAARIDFSTQEGVPHGARHLPSDLTPTKVDASITRDIRSIKNVGGPRTTFRRTIRVGRYAVQYRAYVRVWGIVNVGTYYVIHP